MIKASAKKTVDHKTDDFADSVKPWRTFYGNGTVYVLRGRKFIRLVGANFDIERIDDKADYEGEWFMDSNEVAVCLGHGVTRTKLASSLRRLIQVLEG